MFLPVSSVMVHNTRKSCGLSKSDLGLCAVGRGDGGIVEWEYTVESLPVCTLIQMGHGIAEVPGNEKRNTIIEGVEPCVCDDHAVYGWRRHRRNLTTIIWCSRSGEGFLVHRQCELRKHC